MAGDTSFASWDYTAILFNSRLPQAWRTVTRVPVSPQADLALTLV